MEYFKTETIAIVAVRCVMFQIDREEMELKRKLVESIEEGDKAMSRSLDKIARTMDSFATSMAKMAEVMASTQQRYMPMGNSYNMPMGINHQPPMMNNHSFPMGNMPLRDNTNMPLEDNSNMYVKPYTPPDADSQNTYTNL